MEKGKVKQLVLAALCAALTAAATMVIQIPSPLGGYVNLGDCMVLLSAWILGPAAGAAAGGLGSALADILTGYGYYAPGTLLIKAVMALAAGLVFSRTAGKGKLTRRLVGGVLAEIIMVAGYFGYAAVILGHGLGAAAGVPGNLVQGAAALAAALVLAQLLQRSGALPKK